MKVADGYTSAFIVEAVVKSKGYALARAKGANWKIASGDIVAALTELRPQYDMMHGNKVQNQPTVDTTMQALVARQVEDQMPLTKLEAAELMDRIRNM